MTFIRDAVMFGWVPLVIGLFLIMPPKRAVLVAFFGAWLFLPMATYEIPKMPDFTKMSATSFGVLLGALLFDFGRLGLFRPRWFDLPVVMFCVVAPLGTSISNMPALSLYDGASEAMRYSTAWLLPYFIGRVYFTSQEDMRILAMCLVVGALIYVPICWFEARMSPQLHLRIYGAHQHDFVHAKRGGGFRPRGFMQTGLMVGTWICSGALVAWMLWRSRTPMRLGSYRLAGEWVFPLLVLTGIICKSVGAFVLALGGFVALQLSRWGHTRLLMVAMLCIAPVFVVIRANNLWTAEAFIAFVEDISPEKAQSLQYRFDNDEVLADHALHRPWFGWGGYNRNLTYSKDSHRMAATDGMWIIALGKTGFVGLFGFLATLATPMFLFLIRQRPATWFTPSMAPVTAMVTIITLYQLDGLFNAMENPLFMLLAGGVCSFLGVYRPVPRLAAKPHPQGPATPTDDPDPDPAPALPVPTP